MDADEGDVGRGVRRDVEAGSSRDMRERRDEVPVPVANARIVVIIGPLVVEVGVIGTYKPPEGDTTPHNGRSRFVSPPAFRASQVVPASSD